MSSIKMCDFCGVVTGNMAAEVAIRPYNTRNEVIDRLVAGESLYNRSMDSYVKDACSVCIETLLVVPKPMLSGGNDPDSPFGTVEVK